MSSIHVLEQRLDALGNTYKVVLHKATTIANNSAGFPWATAIVNSGNATPSVLLGLGGVGDPAAIPAAITQAEADAVAAGTTFELATEIHVGDAANPTSVLNSKATDAMNQHEAALQIRLKYFGRTQG